MEPAFRLVDNELQLLVQFLQHVHMTPVGVQVLGLAEAATLDQPGVKGRIVGHHESRWTVEPVDQ